MLLFRARVGRVLQCRSLKTVYNFDMAMASRGFSDLQKEFRTLQLLAWALLILGAGLTVGGFGVALLTRETKPAPKRPAVVQTEETPADDAPPPRAKPNFDPKSDTQTFMFFTGQLGSRTGLLGLVFLAIGGVLRWVISNTVEDEDQVEMSDELFKTYAAQLALAAKRKEKDRKKLSQ
jgi:hypothetical protein